jgi:hypothetical protein
MTTLRAPLPRISPARRALVGVAWALGWTLAWAGALLLFPAGARAAPLALAVSSGPVSLPIYVAQARGFFADEGLELQVRECRSGRECYGLLADGRVDVATAAELMVALGGAKRGAAQACGVPIALISLVDAHRQWSKARVGLPGAFEMPRDLAFCDHAIRDGALFEVPDTTLDPRFAGNPYVTGEPNVVGRLSSDYLTPASQATRWSTTCRPRSATGIAMR